MANSIAEVGLLHPILVVEQETGFRLIAGYRRLTACKTLGLDTIAAFVLSKDASTRQIQIVENVHREDLNPIDRAAAVQLFIQENQFSVSEAAKRLGIPRTTINDWLAVLDLPDATRTPSSTTTTAEFAADAVPCRFGQALRQQDGQQKDV